MVYQKGLPPGDFLFCFDGTGWASTTAFSTADTIYTVWVFPNRNIKLAGFLACTAIYALTSVDLVAVNGKAVKQSINCTQRA